MPTYLVANPHLAVTRTDENKAIWYAELCATIARTLVIEHRRGHNSRVIWDTGRERVRNG